MPNWCHNRLIVTGAREDVHAFCRRAAHPTARYALPSSRARGDRRATDLQWDAAGPSTPLSLHALVPVPLDVRRLGYVEAGHIWQREHWGCKWDVDRHVIRRAVPCGVHFDFDSAWEPPAAWFAAVAPQFPQLCLVLEYVEPGKGFGGRLIAVAGEGAVTTRTDDPQGVAQFEREIFGAVGYGVPSTESDDLPDWRYPTRDQFGRPVYVQLLLPFPAPALDVKDESLMVTRGMLQRPGPRSLRRKTERSA